MELIPFSLWGDALWCGQEVVREAPHEQAIRSLFPDPIPARGADLDTDADLDEAVKGVVASDSCR